MSSILRVSTVTRPVATVVTSATIPEVKVATSIVKKSTVLDGTLYDIKRRYEEESRHVQNNFELDYNNQINLIKTIEELEILLEQEKIRSVEWENKYNVAFADLENERRLRIQVEHDNTILKEELRRAEGIIHENDLLITRLQIDVTSLEAENDTLRAEIHRITDLFNLKLQEIEDKYLLQIGDLDAEILSLRNALEVQRIDYENRLKDLDRDWSLKYGRLEDVVRDKDRLIVELEAEIRRLKETISQVRIAADEDLRRQLALVREEENHRYDISLKSIEARLHQVELERDALIRKNQELTIELSNKERLLQELRIKLEGEIARLRAEISDLRGQVNALTVANESLRGEISARDLTIRRLEAEITNLDREIQRLKDVHAQEIARLLNDHNNERRRWEEAERLLKLRIDDLEIVIRNLETENAKLRADLERLKGNLADNVNKTIFQTFVGYETSPVVVKALF